MPLVYDQLRRLASRYLNSERAGLYLGKYENFLASLPNVNRVYILSYRGFGAFYLNQRQRALEYFNRAFELDPSQLQAQLGKALALGITGEQATGVELLRQAEARVIESGVSDPEGLYTIAQVYSVLGAKHEALHMLEHSIGGGFFCYPYFKSDPLLRAIRGEPEFAELLHQARQRHERFRATFFAAHARDII